MADSTLFEKFHPRNRIPETPLLIPQFPFSIFNFS